MISTRRQVLVGGAGAAALLALPVRAAADLDDVAIVRRACSLLHPGLLRYNSPRQIAARFDAFERDWRASDNLSNRYLTLTRLTAAFKCGHSYANFYNQKAEIADALFGAQNKVPFSFRWIGDQMVVTGDPSETMPRGSIINRMDGRSTASILKALIPLTRADGNNDGKRRQLLSVMGVDDYETFDCLYPLAFPAADRFRIEARGPRGKRIDVVVDAIDLKTRRAQRVGSAPADKDAAAWSITHIGKIATLTMDGWGLYNSKWDWQAWLDAAFEDMARRGTDRLIVDIRRNEGGLDCGNDIIARLIDSPILIDNYARRVRYRRVPEDLAPFCDTWDASFKDWRADAMPFDDRFYTLKGESDGPAEIKPKGPRFRGRVIVLTSAENSSATFQFANLMKTNRLGILIGETTGGNRRGINGGAFFFVRLPQSGLEFDLPLIGYFPKTTQPDAGLVPDVAAPATALDIASGRDSAMEKAIAA
jgi:Peptidase family S41